MKKIGLILLSILAMVSTSFARLGETPVQCEARYGKPVEVDKEKQTITYHKAGLWIYVFFWNGKAQAILIAKLEQDAIGNPEKLSDTEVQTLLEANAGGSTWKKTQSPNLIDKGWVTEDESRIAIYYVLKHHVYITTTEFQKHQSELEDAEEKKKLEGF